MGLDDQRNPDGSELRVVRLAPTVRRVELEGLMPIGWLGQFTRGATALGLDIVRGRARRSATRVWSAQLEIRGVTPFELDRTDFLALARAPRSEDADDHAASEALGGELQSFSLVRAAERSDLLVLEVAAKDRVGFLAALLEHLAGFVLFPEEIDIDTRQGEAHDQLLLSSVGGQSPPPELEQSLRASLNALKRDRPSLWPST